MVRQFDESYIHKADWETDTPYWFDVSMVSSCAPLFDDCESNYEVEEKLKAAKVVGRGCHSDTEYSALVMNFKGKGAALNFIKRLNAYLIKKAEKMNEARKF